PQLVAQARPPVALIAAEPYVEYQKGADIVRRLPGSRARVAIETQKPVVSARLEVLGQAGPGGETVRHEVTMTLLDGGLKAEGTSPFDPGAPGYRIRGSDSYGFANADPPRRSIRSVPLDPPQVALLPEQFRYPGDKGSAEDYEVEGMPVPLGRKIRIG